MNDKMKNLAVRTLSGAVLAVVVLGAIAWSQWSFGLLLAALTAGGMFEFYALTRRQGIEPQRFVGLVTGLLLLALNFAVACGGVELQSNIRLLAACGAALLLLVPAMFICELWRRYKHPAANIATTLAGVFYVALPFSLMCYFPRLGGGGWNPGVVFGFVAVIWANDVCAYLVGMTCGRRRLFERLSPKKSWEGFFGGLCGAVAAGVLAGRLLGAGLWTWGGLALLIAVTAVLGDLAESMFKRAAGVKDSGTLIPGHGGVLDRFDAMLISAPFAFVYMLFFM